MSAHSFHGVAPVAMLLALLAGGGAARAQFGPIYSPPVAPTSPTPAAGVYNGTNAAMTPVVFTWSQFFPTGSGPFIRPAATHFVVCLDLPSDPACSWTLGDWRESIASPTAAMTRSGNTFTLRPSPQRVIAATELNQDLRLSIGACSSQANRSCAFITSRIMYSTSNLKAVGTGIDRMRTTPSSWVLDVRVDNNGTMNVGPVDATVEYWEVLRNGTDCLRTVDVEPYKSDNSLVAFDVNGTQTLLPSLPRVNGVYSGAPIQGMYRFGSPYDLAVMAMNQVVASGTTGRSAGNVNFPVADSGGMRAFVVMSRLDTGGILREFDETDNTWAQCKIR
jgi:hypothetical protein